MARYQHLPIYKTSYELLQRVVFMTKEFPREFKFTIGQKLRDEVLDLLVLIYRANNVKDRLLVLSGLLEKILVIELLVRLCRDMRLFSKKHYAGLVEMTESIARQAEGWKKSFG